MIKLFEQFNNEQEIHEICKKYDIENYSINPDGSIDVDGGVKISNIHLNRIPLRFNKVSGDFVCTNNQLISLKGCPKQVGGDFSCSKNKLTSLEGSPKEVGGDFYCSYNQLTSLVGSPERINGTFFCYENQLTSLEGSPIIIEGNLSLSHNPISVIDSSIEIRNAIYIYNTNFDDKIKSLSSDKLRILFEHGGDYDIFIKNGSINDSRLERLFRDFEI